MNSNETRPSELELARSGDRYSAYIEDWDLVTFQCPMLDGFFSATDPEDGEVDFIMRAARIEEEFAKKLATSSKIRARPGNIDLNILDPHHTVIGSYFIAGPSITDLQKSADGAENSYDITISGWSTSPHREIEQRFWEVRQSGGPHITGTWKGLSPTELEGWISVCRNSWNRPQHPSRAPKSNIVIDGRDCTSKDGFYAAIGEAVNGPGGYFGFDLDSLIDCLRGGFGLTTPATITWINSNISRLHINQVEIADIVDALNRPGITLSLA